MIDDHLFFIIDLLTVAKDICDCILIHLLVDSCIYCLAVRSIGKTRC